MTDGTTLASETLDAPAVRAAADVDYLARAHALRPFVRSQSAAVEQGGTMSPAMVEALKAERIFWMTIPAALGGGGRGLVDSMRVVEEISFADASVGWALMVNLTMTAVASAFVGDAAVDSMFGGKELPVMAGMLGPSGKARAVEGGYLAAGNFSFGSGTGHSDWIGGGMMIMGDDGPRLMPNGMPEVQACVIPRDRVEFLGGWNVTGLVGTGSFDYRIPEQFVPRDFTFERTDICPKRGGPLFSMGLAAFGLSGHAAVVIGLMKAALSEVAKIAVAKKRPGYANTIAQNDPFKLEFATNEAVYQAARDYVYRTFQAAEDQAMSGQPLTAEQRARMRQATTWLHQAGDRVVRFCHAWAGSEAFRNTTAISRISRDMSVAIQHVFVDPMTLVDAAPALLDYWQDLQ